jgi:glycosyltransferase involved in cell wall biosynthesis
MNVLVFGKYPPIQGGTSSQVLNTVRHLAAAGHRIDVVTNGREAEPGSRAILTNGDLAFLEALHRVDGPGSISSHHTTPLGSTAYLPWAQPYGSKLFGLGVDLTRSTSYDLVVGWYFEPYGLVAAQVASAAGVPLLLRHAGSDLARLSRHPDLRSAYRWMLGRAEVILTGPRSRRVLTGLGADVETFRFAGPGSLPDYFTGPPAPIDVIELKGAARAAFAATSLRGPVRAMLEGNLEVAPVGPVIGICGKVAESKGSYDLLLALERMAEDGVEFTLLGALGGQEALLVPWLEALEATAHLRHRSIILPLLAPWRMPGFFDACDVVCLLERAFDVALHRTRVPLEVFQRGRTLVLSEEMSQKVYFSEKLEDRANYLSVEDPEDTGSLVAVLVEALTRPDLRDTVAAGGRRLATALASSATVDGPAVAIQAVLTDLAAR